MDDRSAAGKMTSRERVAAAARGLPVDRVPVMLWFDPHLACKMISTDWRTRDAFRSMQAKWMHSLTPKVDLTSGSDLRRAIPLLMEPFSNSAYAIELGADIALLPGAGMTPRKYFFDHGRFKAVDAFGTVRGFASIYADVTKPVVNSIDDLKTLRFPNPLRDPAYKHLRKFRKKYPDACLMCGVFGVQDYFSTQVWSMDQFMIALCDHPAEMKEFQKRWADWAVEIVHQSAACGVDMIFIYDDYGYTDHTLLSMRMWQEFTLPHLIRLIQESHKAGALTMLHSCGYQEPFVPFYIEAGLDFLEPLQPKAGNDFSRVVAAAGGRLGFCTGIDIQLGEQMPPDRFRQDILDRYRIGKNTGRFILGTTHMTQYSMPHENLKIMLDTVGEIQNGLHG